MSHVWVSHVRVAHVGVTWLSDAGGGVKTSQGVIVAVARRSWSVGVSQLGRGWHARRTGRDYITLITTDHQPGLGTSHGWWRSLHFQVTCSLRHSHGARLSPGLLFAVAAAVKCTQETLAELFIHETVCYGVATG